MAADRIILRIITGFAGARLRRVVRRALFAFRVNGASDQPSKGLSEARPSEQEALSIDIWGIGHVGHFVYGEPHVGFGDLLDKYGLHRDILHI